MVSLTDVAVPGRRFEEVLDLTRGMASYNPRERSKRARDIKLRT
jgi:hypothetical protein